MTVFQCEISAASLISSLHSRDWSILGQPSPQIRIHLFFHWDTLDKRLLHPAPAVGREIERWRKIHSPLLFSCEGGGGRENRFVSFFLVRMSKTQITEYTEPLRMKHILKCLICNSFYFLKCRHYFLYTTLLPPYPCDKIVTLIN